MASHQHPHRFVLAIPFFQRRHAPTGYSFAQIKLGLLTHTTFSLSVFATNTLSCRVVLTDTISVSVALCRGLTRRHACLSDCTPVHFFCSKLSAGWLLDWLTTLSSSIFYHHTQALYIDGFDRSPHNRVFAPRTIPLTPLFNYAIVFRLNCTLHFFLPFFSFFRNFHGTL